MKSIFKPAVFAFMVSVFAAGAADISLPVYSDSLANGLKILIVPDTSVAVVSCRLYYFAGSMYEYPGTTGLSHMFEHMMFKGTKKLGTSNYYAEKKWMDKIDSVDNLKQYYFLEKGLTDSDSIIVALKKENQKYLEAQRKYIKKDEIWELYQNNGATNLNAWTADDMTAYIVTLPANKLELFFWIESDRMRSPILREFDSEHDVVTEERRMRYDNIPVNNYWERLNALFYVAHPYRMPTIGWMSDIHAYTREKLQNHIKKYYTPDNAIVVLVGKVDQQEARKAIRKYFGGISRAETPKQEIVTREPQPIGQTRFTVYDNVQPRFDMLFHTPGYGNDSLYALDVIENMLSGRSGRLYRRLVTQEKICTGAGAENEIRLHNGLFHVWATFKNGTDVAKVEQVIAEELGRLSQELPQPSEMIRTQNTIRIAFINDCRNLETLSDRLAWFTRLGNYNDLLTYPGKIAAVKPELVKAAAARFLNTQDATIGQMLMKSAPENDEKK